MTGCKKQRAPTQNPRLVVRGQGDCGSSCRPSAGGIQAGHAGGLGGPARTPYVKEANDSHPSMRVLAGWFRLQNAGVWLAGAGRVRHDSQSGGFVVSSRLPAGCPERSEERRVGKECGGRGGAGDEKK